MFDFTFRRRLVAGVPVIALCLVRFAVAAEIHVPGGVGSIQAAIDAAVPGDIVLVAPGTYVENIDFLGKEIVLASEQGPAVTIIDGGGVGTVVSLVSGEGPGAVLRGFTIRNGFAAFDGGGVLVGGGAPVIQGNVITGNLACDGPGMTLNASSATVVGNRITGNRRTGCGGGIGGGGIKVIGAASARITRNLIADNDSGDGGGGGLSLFAAGTPTISNNLILRNHTDGRGGAIYMVNQSDANIVQNLMAGNSSGQEGGGVYWLVPSGARGPVLLNNTIAYNRARIGGSAIHSDGFESTAQLINNILVAAPGGIALFCGDFDVASLPVLQGNDIYSASGDAYGGLCMDETGMNGNISADPLFVSVSNGNFRLQAGSPAIDAGLPVPRLPISDLEGDPRVLDGNADNIATIDIGADEYAP